MVARAVAQSKDSFFRKKDFSMFLGKDEFRSSLIFLCISEENLSHKFRKLYVYLFFNLSFFRGQS